MSVEVVNKIMIFWIELLTKNINFMNVSKTNSKGKIKTIHSPERNIKSRNIKNLEEYLDTVPLDNIYRGSYKYVPVPTKQLAHLIPAGEEEDEFMF